MKVIRPPLYDVWRGIKQRCHNPRSKPYPQYGGRGIYVCDEWRASFAAFSQDMGERPEGYTLDRIDNNGPYSPENCRWTDWVTQQNNRRDNVTLTLGERTFSVSAWAKELNMSQATLWFRLKDGWSVERALTEPVNTNRRNRLAKAH